MNLATTYAGPYLEFYGPRGLNNYFKTLDDNVNNIKKR